MSRNIKIRVSLLLALSAIAIVAMVLVGCGSRPGCEPIPITQPLSEMLAKAKVAENVPGVILGVDMPGDDTPPFYLTEGVSDISTNTAMDSAMRYRIASATKSFVAATTILLAQEGKLNLDDTINEYLPTTLVPAVIGDKVTIRHLLHHTSGIYNFIRDQAMFAEFIANPTKHWEPEELVAKGISLTNTSQYTTPFTGFPWSYSNTNYIILGLIIEEATGQNLETEIARLVTGPMGLTDTELPTTSAIDRAHVHGYTDYDGDGVLADYTTIDPSFPWSTGGMISSTKDLLKFLDSYVNCDSTIFTTASCSEIHNYVDAADTALHPEYGLFRLQYGSGLARINSEYVGHAGQFAGYNVAMYYDRSYDLGVVVMTNKYTYDEGAPTNILRRSIEVMVSSGAVLPAGMHAASVGSGVTVDSCSTGELPSSYVPIPTITLGAM